MPNTSKYQELLNHLQQVHHLTTTLAVLEWDMQVNLPPAGYGYRGEQIGTVTKMRHELFTSDKTAELLDASAQETGDLAYDSDEASMIRVVRQDYEQQTRFPSQFVADWARITTEAHETWAKARSESNFRHFQPTLQQVMDMARQRADYLGYSDQPYDALLGEYERGITTAEVKRIFDGHKPQLVELIAAIRENAGKVDDSVLHQPLDLAKQREFAMWAAENIGYDFQRGRQDVAVHPFATGFNRSDVRITTRYYPDFLNPALFGTMHEAGHGMYEQGSAPRLAGNMLEGGTSLGVHESQSRMWENMVGRSKPFWTWALPKLQETFPGQFDVDLNTFYGAINRVAPSYIRVEADEATYNLHIMLRFEIETGLLNGSIEVAHLPEEWNDRFESFLGISPRNDAEGVLQDVHWSAGLVGYFPTYALGNLLAAQYYAKALESHPQIPQEATEGKFSTLLTWLNENIHQYGRKFTMNELTERVTGGAIDAGPYIAYLQQKYGEIYGV
jgi:carboxypeptidase Taq